MGRLIVLAVLVSCNGDIASGSHSDAGAAGGDGPHSDGHVVWVDSSNGDGNAAACINMQTPPGDGHHNTGKDCMQGCHNHGFTISGTLYTTANSNTAITGATIQITDNNNQVLNLVTMLDGNFYTSTPVAFPLTIVASECPSTTRMTATANTGACNSCHAGGTSMQMHLP
jgi:hypothetical protein